MTVQYSSARFVSWFGRWGLSTNTNTINSTQLLATMLHKRTVVVRVAVFGGLLKFPRTNVVWQLVPHMPIYTALS